MRILCFSLSDPTQTCIVYSVYNLMEYSLLVMRKIFKYNIGTIEYNSPLGKKITSYGTACIKKRVFFKEKSIP